MSNVIVVLTVVCEVETLIDASAVLRDGFMQNNIAKAIVIVDDMLLLAVEFISQFLCARRRSGEKRLPYEALRRQR